MPAPAQNSPRPWWQDTRILVVLTTVVSVAVVFALMDYARWDYAFDFRLLWLAGSTWLHGYSPYMPEFDALYAAQFGAGQASWHVFNYPPYFALVAIGLAALPYGVAAKLWIVLNVVCIVLSASLLASGPGLGPALDPRSGPVARSWFVRAVALVATVVFALTSYAGGYSLFYGQTSLLVLLGASLLVRGYVDRRAVPLALGLVLLSLKPNVGLLPGVLIACSAYDFEQRQWQVWALRPVFAALVFVLAGTGLAVAIAGFDATLPGFVARLEAYNATPPSAAYSLTGLPYLVDTLSGTVLPLWLTLLFAAFVSAVAVWRATSRAMAVFAVLAATFFFVPLHTYDLIATLVLVPLVWRLRPGFAVAAALGLVLIHRCINLALEINPRTWFDDGLLPATLGTLLLLLASVAAGLPGLDGRVERAREVLP